MLAGAAEDFEIKTGLILNAFFLAFEIFIFLKSIGCPPDPWHLAGGGKLPQNCSGKHIQFISIESNLMLCDISDASVMTCSGSVSHDHNSRNMSPICSDLKRLPISYSETLI